MPSKLSPTEQRILEAVSRPEGLNTQDAKDYCLNFYALRTHIGSLRRKGYRIDVRWQPRERYGDGHLLEGRPRVGRTKGTYFLVNPQ